MSLQEEIIKEGDIIQDHKNRLAVEYDEHGLDRIITKVCDACIQAITDNPHKNPIEAIADMRRKG